MQLSEFRGREVRGGGEGRVEIEERGRGCGGKWYESKVIPNCDFGVAGTNRNPGGLSLPI